MARHSKNISTTKDVRKAQRAAARAAKRAAKSEGTLSAAASTHIKQHTKGTSNEISFSVLHALRAQAIADADEGKKSRAVAPTPKTMAEVAAEEARNEAHAALGLGSGADEATGRSKRTRRRALQAGAAVALCAAVVAGVAFAVGQSVSANQQRQNDLSQAVAAIEEADNALFAFDGIVVSAMQGSLEQMAADGTALRYEECKPTLDDVEQQIERARGMIEGVQGSLASAEDREAANEMLITLNARQSLIDAGVAAMDETVVLIDLYQNVQNGWNGLLDADALARDAAVLSGYATTATLEAALTKTDEAIDAFAAVRNEFSQAQQDVAEQLTYQADLQGGSGQASSGEAAEGDAAAAEAGTPTATLRALDATLTTYLDYVNLRIDAQYEAKRSTQALIDHDAATATEANDAYNTLDSRAVALIRSADDQPLQPVVDLYEQEREGLFAAYEQARLRASQADAYLSTYLEGKN